MNRRESKKLSPEDDIDGVRGLVELAPGYLKRVYEIVRKAGGLCMAYEVQTRFGRTGTHYWGFQTKDVIPDIVTMAKGIGNGFPSGAVVTTPESTQKVFDEMSFKGNALIQGYNKCKFKAKVRINQQTSSSSAHQVVSWKNYLYVYGDEFTSPNQECFHDYKYFWMLDLKTNQWEQLDYKGCHSPRSGHRMPMPSILYVLLVAIFFNDLLVFDLGTFKWQEIKPTPGCLWPSARSGFQLFVYQDNMYGGYSKEVSFNKNSSEKGICHSDMWLLDLKTWVRIKETFALASTSSEETDWAGLLHLIKFYKN
ncbi:hypothetical protein LXL04_006356 [Taraxacum kok-saghyz]